MKLLYLALGTIVVVAVGCVTDGQGFKDTGKYVAPPAAMMQRPGPMVDGPGPGVLAAFAQPQHRAFATSKTQVKFVEPKGMAIGWQIDGGFAENQLVAPQRYDFPQGYTYRLKISVNRGTPENPRVVEVYPTMQIHPAHPATDAYLAHSPIPVELTEEDLDQIEANNFVTKVIYLPDPEFQNLAIAGVETLVSTRLEPGVDPVAKAEQQGTIMAVLRIGGRNLELAPAKGGAGKGGVNPVSYRVLDGDKGEKASPQPIGPVGGAAMRMPSPMIAAGHGYPGAPAHHPYPGMGPAPVWGQPTTGTPIGLVGPTHLPFGGPAGLRSHTVVNRTKTNLPGPVRDFTVDVRHDPGYRLPKPVSYMSYREKHPVFGPGELSQPSGGGAPGSCPVPTSN